jgi:hypothetical protein
MGLVKQLQSVGETSDCRVLKISLRNIDPLQLEDMTKGDISNSMMADCDCKTTEQLIAAVVIVAVYEALWCGSTIFRITIQGLTHMTNLRYGLSLGKSRSAGRICSGDYEQEPV